MGKYNNIGTKVNLKHTNIEYTDSYYIPVEATCAAPTGA